MRADFLRSAVAVALAVYLAASPGFAAPAAVAAIGTMVTTGAFRLNHATVHSNATLFDGAMVETGPAPARIDLASGARLDLEPESTGRVFGGRLALERGAARIDRASFAAESASGAGAGFTIAARGVTIQSDVSAATGRIALIGARRVEVTALTGSFRALNSQGMLIAKITAGKALALEPQSVPGPARMTGRMVRQRGHYLLTDETTNVTVEVAGSDLTKPGLTKALGQRVEVTGYPRQGTTPASEAVQVIEVAQITPAPPAGSGPAGGAPSGSGGAGGTAPAAAGGSAGGAAISVTMIAVIGGVAAAAVVGGLAATGSLGGSTAAPVSR